MSYKEIQIKILSEKKRLKRPNVILKNILHIYEKEIGHLFSQTISSKSQKKLAHAKKIDEQIKNLLKKIYLQYGNKVSRDNRLLYFIKGII